ncbi:AbrB/MazE/SpoVT family DNA-binding domain-containing protein [Alkalibacillus salilacus]|uniref:Bifunctional DNA-binding transcriptional regulator/antitoxin component of YhaV-PrlF toxin-antitoxin module n=1 Tax=Alkalibacillus salilacus TaxID=284582 RepID=A0ABT9VB77_9BACI|nr:AbrB/MazE/SpoVT family DNA-binding domain-containing protein [Alkalibacillus salilacus]MDQ0158164.1 bifunctional DNA-binding transcriptional regulator/antitoxin component of YhaV-PrlF toxin-antitoxin module [Alkalibacillus salilacus]
MWNTTSLQPTSELEGTKLNDKKVDDLKHISVSKKRQITIPKYFYEKLNMGNEIICELREDEIVLRKAPNVADFSEEILKDLIAQGYEGQELIKAFQSQKAKIRPAVEELIAESREAAKQYNPSKNDETNELFGDLKE